MVNQQVISPNKKPRTVSSVETTCAIINELDKEGNSRIVDIADNLDLSNAAVYSHLVTLKEQGLVRKIDNMYGLSLRFLNIGQNLRYQSDLNTESEPELKKLADETGEYAHLVVEQNGWGYILHREKGELASATMSSVGRKFHLHYLAAGKAILAYLPEKRVRSIAEKHGLPGKTKNTIREREELVNELEQVREHGFAVDKQEQFNRVRCVGAAIREPSGSVLGALSISAPVSRMRGERFESELPEIVSNTAKVIEMKMEIHEANQ
jgi:DNA-binding IclR family transcriptional regulator